MTNIILNGSAAVLIQQSAASGFSLQNNGPGNVYLDNNASVSPGSGFTVVPGVSVPLNAGAVLYGCTDTGKTATVQLLDGATAAAATVVEANVPGAVEVTGSVTATITNADIPVSGNVNATITNASIPVTGSVDIASGSVSATITNADIPVSGNVNATITNASIPVTGSVDISSGSVDITSGNVAVSGVVGSQSQAKPVLLSQTVTAASPAGSPQPLTAVPALPTSGYSSIIVSLADLTGAPLAFTSMMKLVITQYLNGVQVGTYINAHYLLGNCNGSVQVPVIGDTVQVSGQYTNSSTNSGNITVQVIGSSEVITTPRYLSYNLSGKGSIATGGYYQDSVGIATLNEFVNCRNGAAEVAVLAATGSSTGNLNLQLADFDNPGGGVILMGTGAIAAGGALNIPVILPMRPVYISARGTAGSIVYSLQQ